MRRCPADETDSLTSLFEFLTDQEKASYGANWRLRYRENPEKFRRVVADLRAEKREGKSIKSFAAVANLRWNEFTPRTAR
jgi:hypothetical protein